MWFSELLDERRAQRDHDTKVDPNWFPDFVHGVLQAAKDAGVAEAKSTNMLHGMAAAWPQMSPRYRRLVHRAVVQDLVADLVHSLHSSRAATVDNPDLPNNGPWCFRLNMRLRAKDWPTAAEINGFADTFVPLLVSPTPDFAAHARDLVVDILLLGRQKTSPLPALLAWREAAVVQSFTRENLPLPNARVFAVERAAQARTLVYACCQLLSPWNNPLGQGWTWPEHTGNFVHLPVAPSVPARDWVTPLCAQADDLVARFGVQSESTAGLPDMWRQLTPHGQWLVFQNFVEGCFVSALQMHLDWRAHNSAVPFPLLPDRFLDGGLLPGPAEVNAAVALLNARLPDVFDAGQRTCARDAATALVMTGQIDGDFLTPYLRLSLELWGHNHLFERHVSAEVRAHTLNHLLAGGAESDSPFAWAHNHLRHQAWAVVGTLMHGLRLVMAQQIALEKSSKNNANAARSLLAA